MSEEQTEVTMTADSKESARQKRRIIGRPPKIVLFGILVVALIGFGAGAYLWKANEGGKVVFTIEGKKYREDEVRELIKYPVENENMSEEDAAKQAFEYLKTKHAAKKLGVSLNDDELKQALDQNFFDLDSEARSSKWISLATQDIALKQKLDIIYGQGVQREGYLFTFPFDRYLFPDIDGHEIPGQGDQRLIELDKSYAQNQANFYHKQIEQKEISPEKAISDILNNPILSISMPNYSGSFSAFDLRGLSENFIPSFARESILSDNIKLGLSDIKTGSVSFGGEDIENCFYFIFLKKKDNEITKEKFGDTLSSQNAKYYGLGKRR